MITDTAFYRNPHYHASSDTAEKLDYRGKGEVIKGFIRNWELHSGSNKLCLK